jgi:hypothetical protein
MGLATYLSAQLLLTFGSCKCITVLRSNKFGSRCDCVIIRALIRWSLFKDNMPSFSVYGMDT